MKRIFLNERSQAKAVVAPQPVHRSKASEEEILPLNSIQVTHHVGISTVPIRDTVQDRERNYDDNSCWQHRTGMGNHSAALGTTRSVDVIEPRPLDLGQLRSYV
jgi:hypothetical protein